MEKRVMNVYERFKSLQKLKKPLYLSAFTIVTSCKEAMEAQGNNDPSAMEYLECLLNIKDNFRKITQTKDEGFVYALSAVVSMVPVEVISKINSILLEYVLDVIEKTSITVVTKYCVVIIQYLLESKTQDQWKNEEETVNLYIKLFNFCLNSKDMIKRQAIRSFMIVSQYKDKNYFSKAFGQLESTVFKILDQGDVNTPRAVACLNFLNCALQTLPSSISSNILKKLLDYSISMSENVTLVKNIYFVIETMFAAIKLSSSFVEDYLNFMLENTPSTSHVKSLKGDNELMIVGYCLAVAQVAVHYKKLNGVKVLTFLPSLVSILSEYLVIENNRIRTGAFTAIKNLLFYTLEISYFKIEEKKEELKIDDISFDLLTIRDSSDKIHPIRKVVYMFLYCLDSRFESCYSEILKLISTLIEIGKAKTIEFGGYELLNAIGDLQIKKQAYNPWIDCLGKFLEHYKSENFFNVLPLKLLDFDMNSESYSFDSRSYLLPVIKKYAKKENFNFYIEHFMPLIDSIIVNKLSAIQVKGTNGEIKDVKQERQPLKEKKYETLIYQILEIFPSYCHNYNEENAMLQKLLTRFDKIIEKNQYNARVVVLNNLCALIDYLKEVPKDNLIAKKARILLMKKAIPYINTLSGLYLDSISSDIGKPSLIEVKANEHSSLLMTISKLGWICKRMKLYDLFFNELINIVQEFTDFETGQNTVENDMDVDTDHKKLKNAEREETKKKILRKIDIIICLMERIKLTKKHCELIINFADSISKSKITQKKAFKILAIILSNYEISSYEELKELFSKLTGYAFSQNQQKHKLIMLRIFLSKIKKPKRESEEMDAEDNNDENENNDSDQEDEEQNIKKVDITDQDRSEIATTILPEIITGFCSLQTKSKKLSEMILMELIKLYVNNINDLIKKLLAGFAGDTVETRAASVDILTKVLKENYNDFNDANLKKITNIMLLFLKEKSHHLQRSVLKCLKRVLAIVSVETIRELCKTILENLVSFEGKEKLLLNIKYIIKRLIKRLGKEEVKKLCPSQHVALIDYVDKMMKREVRQIQKNRELIAEDEEERERKRLIEGERIEELSDSDHESGSSDESSDDDLVKRDAEMIDYDIPIVRHLREVNNTDTKGESENATDKKSKIDRILTTVDDEFSSHFYDNPVLMVKKRKEERRKLEELNKRQKEKEERMRNKIYDDDEDDLFYERKTNKFIVKDAFKNERLEKVERKRKREERDEIFKKMVPKDVQNLLELEEKAKRTHKRQKVDDMDLDSFIPLHYLKSQKNKDATKEGHFIKQSGASFKGTNSKSDVLKPGKMEPYAYIKLNPKMINKKHRDKAVKSFGVVVDKKKQDKRKQNEGMLSGLKVTKK